MSRESEGFLFFGVFIIVLVTNITFAIVRMNKTRNFKKTSAQAIGLSFLLCILECIWWYFQAADDWLYQFFGWLYFGIAFVMSSFINTRILSSMKKKFNL